MNRKSLIGVLLLVALSAPLSAQSVKAGIDAWQRSDYAAAVAIWTPLAEHGDADAQFNLGQAYRLGRGVQTDLSAAKSWFERAANQGHVDAQTTLGLLLFQNNDQAEGLKWLKMAADRGEPRALLVYGTALVNGDGVTQDPVLGYAYINRAAALGLAPAKDTLAQLDKILPLSDRKLGARAAAEMAKARPRSKSRVSSAAPAESARARPLARRAAEATDIARAEPAAKAPGDKASASPGGAWRIQLGAFSRSGLARALYERLSTREALAGRKPFYVATGTITRLQVGPYESRAAAEAACRSVGVACFPVPAR